MAVKEVKLNQAALKLLAEYSETEGVSPSEAVLRFIPKPRKMSVTAAQALLKKHDQRKGKMSGAQADKAAAAAIDRSRKK